MAKNNAEVIVQIIFLYRPLSLIFPTLQTGSVSA